MQRLSQFTSRQWFWKVALVTTMLLALLLSGTALAAEFESSDVYRLEVGEVIADDLYVAGNQVFIEGTVQGDLIAAGSYVEVNGVVEGDVMATAAAVVINGLVQDDVHILGAGAEISGSIGDDLFVAAGGNSAFPVPGIEQQVDQGVFLVESASIGGDLVVFAGHGMIGGTVAKNLYATTDSFILEAQIGNDVEIDGNTIQIRENANVSGTLNYYSSNEITIPSGVAANVVYNEVSSDEETTSPLTLFVNWLWRTVLILVGFAMLGWLLLRFTPHLLTHPVRAINNQPAIAGAFGLVASILFIFVPLASALLVFLMVLFGGWFPGIVLGLFLFAALALIWFLSPLITGMWLGQRLHPMLGKAPGALGLLLTGVLLVVLLGSIPFIGWFVYLVSFIFAMGGLLLAWRTAGSQVESQSDFPTAA